MCSWVQCSESDMSADKSRESRASDRETPSQPRTVLDPLRPAVVVRRRVIVDPTITSPDHAPLRTFTTQTNPPQQYNFDGTAGGDFELDDEEDNGPPSSVNVARALASLRADELRRVEEIVEADDATPLPLPGHVSEPVEAPSVPTLLVGKEISLSELAKKMDMVPQELATTLVARGFFSMTTKTVLARETARDIATSFGWHVEDAPEPPEGEPAESSPANSAVRSKKKSGASKKAANGTKKRK